MTVCVLDLSEIPEVSITKSLAKGVKLMIEMYKKYSHKN